MHYSISNNYPFNINKRLYQILLKFGKIEVYANSHYTASTLSGYGLEPEEYFVKVGKQHPLGCIGEPDDIAYIDVYLASDESKWTTGAEFVVDGGWTAQ